MRVARSTHKFLRLSSGAGRGQVARSRGKREVFFYDSRPGRVAGGLRAGRGRVVGGSRAGRGRVKTTRRRTTRTFFLPDPAPRHRAQEKNKSLGAPHSDHNDNNDNNDKNDDDSNENDNPNDNNNNNNNNDNNNDNNNNNNNNYNNNNNDNQQ